MTQTTYSNIEIYQNGKHFQVDLLLDGIELVFRLSVSDRTTRNSDFHEVSPIASCPRKYTAFYELFYSSRHTIPVTLKSYLTRRRECFNVWCFFFEVSSHGHCIKRAHLAAHGICTSRQPTVKLNETFDWLEA